MSTWVVILIVVVIYFLFKKDDSQSGEKKLDPTAEKIASDFEKAFRNRESVNKLNDMSEELIWYAQQYWKKHDFASYKRLLSAAETTSFLYQGNKYPQKLVEDLIRENHE